MTLIGAILMENDDRTFSEVRGSMHMQAKRSFPVVN